MRYYAVMKDGVCIAKIVWDGVDPYDFPHPHDGLILDPDNSILVDGADAPQDSEES
jgi:hypothetical protein